MLQLVVEALRAERRLYILFPLVVLYLLPSGALSSLLTSFLCHQYHYSTHQAAVLFSTFLALFFSYSVIAGLLGTKDSYIQGVIVASVCLVLGLLGLGLTPFLYPSLTLIIVGNGYWVANFIPLIGEVPFTQVQLRQTRFILVYVVMNLGGGLGIFLSNFISSHYEAGLPFAILAIFPLLGFIIFLSVRKTLSAAVNPSQKVQDHLSGFIKRAFLFCLSLPILMFFLIQTSFSKVVLVGTVILALIWVLKRMKKLAPSARRGSYFFLFLTGVTVVFFTLYAIEPSVLGIFIEAHVNRRIEGITIPAESYFGLNPIFNVLIGTTMILCIGKLRRWLPSDQKIYLGVLLIGVGFLFLFACTVLAGLLHWHLNSVAIVFVYFILCLGEMFLAPAAYAVVFEYGSQDLHGVFSGMTQMARTLMLTVQL
ncbi:MAG: MFS transporter [Gammaproteobacteria bacterium]|nr:MFS transporter [Gammaproteobacteria bacterium]